MRASKISLSILVAALATAGCMERPKTGPQTDANASYFHVQTFEAVRAGAGKTQTANGIPEDVVYGFRACLRDIAKNETIPGDSPFEISNTITGEIVFDGKTDNGGCVNWSERVRFNALSDSYFLEQIRKIKGTGRAPGEVIYRFAVNPWMAAMEKSSGKDSVVDLTLHQTIIGSHRLIPADQVSKYLEPQASTGSSKLLLDNFQASVQNDRISKSANNVTFGKVTVMVEANPYLVVKDIYDNPTTIQLKRGAIKMVASLVAEVPVLDKDKNETYKRVAITDPANMVESPVGVSNVFRAKAQLNVRVGPPPRGKLYVAIMAYTNAIPALPVAGQALLQNEYDVLCLLSDQGTPVGSNCKLWGDSLGTGGQHFNYQSFLKQATPAQTQLAKIMENEKSNHARPSADGFTLVRYDVAPMPSALYQKVGQDPDRVIEDPMPQTNTDRWVSFTVVACIQEHFRQTKMAGEKFDVTKINGLRKHDLQANESGCITWTDDIHVERWYETQHYFYKKARIVDENLGMDTYATIAINPWERSGFIFSRDDRDLEACADGLYQVSGFNPLGQQVNVCRKDAPTCRDNEIVMFNEGVNGPMSCLPEDQLEEYALRARRQSLISNPNAHPTINMEKFSFNTKQVDYELDDRLGITITRRYLLQIHSKIVRHDSITEGLQGQEPQLPDGIWYLRLVIQRNKQDEPNYVNSPKALEQTDCLNPAANNDPREDRGYLTHWEGAVQVFGGLISVPVSFNFDQLIPLGSNNLILVELSPVDMRHSIFAYRQNPLTDIEEIDQDRSHLIELHDTGLVTKTFRGFFVPLDPTGSPGVGRTCQTAEEVIAAGRAYQQKAAAEAAPELKPVGYNPYLEDKNLAKFTDLEQLSSLVRGVNSSTAPEFPKNVDKDPAIQYLHLFPKLVQKDFWGSGFVHLRNYQARPEDVMAMTTYYNYRDAETPGAMTQEQYWANRYFFMRRLCYYWASGQIYPDLFGMPNPFVASVKGHVFPWAKNFSWASDYTMGDNSWVSDYQGNDFCADPERYMSIDKKIIVKKINTDDVTFLGAQSWNYNISQGFTFNLRESEDSSINESDTFAIKKFDWGPKAYGVSFLNLSSHHNWISSHSNSISEAKSTDVNYPMSIFLIVQKLVLRIPVEQYQQCMIVKPYFKENDGQGPPETFFTHRTWQKGITEAQKEDYIKKGIVICAPESSQATDLYENYFFLAQHFNPSYGSDQWRAANRPWLFEIRGEPDYLKFRSQIETLGQRKGSSFDLLRDTAEERLPQTFLERAGIADHRMPTLDGIYTLIENPESHHPNELFRYLDPDLCEANNNFIRRVFNTLDPTSAFQRKGLGCHPD